MVSPVPLRVIWAVPLVVELLATVSCPVAAPVAVGSNVTCSVTASPGFKVTGNVAPAIEKADPVSVPELMVTGAVPLEVSVSDNVADEFIATSPKLRLAVLIVNCGISAAVPVPLTLTTAVLLVEELLSMVSCPVNAPAAVGAN